MTKIIHPVASIEGDLADKTCLVTGANSGIGKSISVELARRHGNVIMGCRRDYQKELEEIKRKSGNPSVNLRLLDLSSMASIDQFCKALADDGIKLDILICNAGISTGKDSLTQDGFSFMLQVNFLGYARMIRNMLASGVIAMGIDSDDPPRIIFTSSTRHKGPLSIDFDHFGVLPDFSIKDLFKVYGLSKLYLMTYAWELARRLRKDENPEVSIFAFCPGPFRSRIGKNIGLVGRIAMSILPVGPEKAMWPAIYLACSPDLKGKTMVYYHKRMQESPDPRATDPKNGKKVWDMTNVLLDRLDRQNNSRS